MDMRRQLDSGGIQMQKNSRPQRPDALGLWSYRKTTLKSLRPALGVGNATLCMMYSHANQPLQGNQKHTL
jgi:hypothetical protein